MFETTSPKREKLMDDLHQVIADTEALLRMTADQAGESANEVRSRIENRLQTTRAQLAELQDAALTRVKAASNATDEFVHQNPWTSIGIGATVGLVVGLLIARR